MADNFWDQNGETDANLDVPEKVKAGIGLGAKIIETIFALVFPIAWIGFVSVATVLLVMQKDWEMVPIVIPFWLAGVFVVVSAVQSVIRIFRK